MKVIVGFLIILVFYFFGQLVSWLIGGLIPGSIIGMVLLFGALQSKLLKASLIEDISRGLTRNMAIFFIPAGVGLLTATHLIREYWLSILVAAAISTVLVIAVVAITQEKMENRRNKKLK